MVDFIEVSVFLERSSTGLALQWIDTSNPKYFEFSSPCGRIRLLKRNSYPATFAHVTGSTLICGYGPVSLAHTLLTAPLSEIPEETFRHDEFVYIAIDCAQNTLTIQTDAFNALPLFVGTQADRCIISSDFGRTFELLDQKQCTPNTRCIVQYLLAQETHDRTFVKEIQLLYDRKRLTWSDKGVHVALPPDAEMKDNHRYRTGDAREFPVRLEQTFTNYWQKYVGGSPGACDLSCGVDSAVLTGYLADQGYNPIATTALFPEPFRHSQSQKLADFTSRFTAEYLDMPAKHHLDYPWLPVLQGEVSRPFYHYCEAPYHTTFDDLYAVSAHRGVRTVFTGAGADELFEHVDHRHIMDNTFRGEGDYMRTPGFGPLGEYRKGLRQINTHLPIPLMPHSALRFSVMSNSYLRQGLWLVRPFADPTLYAYMQTVPLHYCVDKILLRIYAQARRVPKSIYTPEVNEDFADVNTLTNTKLVPIISFALDTSVLAKNGLIEVEPLKNLLAHGATDSMVALLFKRILFTELNLRSLGMHTL